MNFPKPEQTDGISPVREFKLTTGHRGMVAFSRAMLVENAKDYLLWLASKDGVTKEEAESLTAMLDSPDEENIHLALELIKVKQQ